MRSVRTSLLVGAVVVRARRVCARRAARVDSDAAASAASADEPLHHDRHHRSARAPTARSTATRPYSLPAEEMPPSGTVGPPPNDAADDVPLRMPDTTGTKPNLAAFRGQTLTLRPADQKAYTRAALLRHDGRRRSGAAATSRCSYTDDTTATVDGPVPGLVRHGNATGALRDRPADAALPRDAASDGARCSHLPRPGRQPAAGQDARLGQLPPATDAGRHATAGLPDGAHARGRRRQLRDAGPLRRSTFPNDNDAPSHDGRRSSRARRRQRAAGTRAAPRITLDGTDEAGGSGVEQIHVPDQRRRRRSSTPGPFDFTTEGEHKLEYRSIDRAGNAENFKTIDAQGRRQRADHDRDVTFPGEPLGPDGWYDSEVTVRLQRRPTARARASTRTEYRVDGGDVDAYSGPFEVDGRGRARSSSTARPTSPATRRPTKALSVKRRRDRADDERCCINGAAPVADYTGAVRVAFTRTDGGRLGRGRDRVPARRRRVDAATTARSTSPATAATRSTSARSTSSATSRTSRRCCFTIRPPATRRRRTALPQATPAPAPKPFAALEDVASKLRDPVRAARRPVRGRRELPGRRPRHAAR